MIPTLEEIEARYRLESDKLLKFIQRGSELTEILKFATTKHIKSVRIAISRNDKLIEETEKILELLENQRVEALKLKESETKLILMMEKMKPDFLKFLAENHPEKLDELEDLFCVEIESENH